MRDRVLLSLLLSGAGLLLFMGWDQLQRPVLITWGLSFGGTTVFSILILVLYRVQIQLRESRHELARKEAELSFANEVQRALFPRNLPNDGGLEFAAVCIPAQRIGGDYYDVLRVPDERTVFVVADISGKGISAAILMANLQAVLRTHASGGSTPSEVCKRINRHFHEVTDESRFATFFYAEWDSRSSSLRYVNAGHNPPFLFGTHGTRRLKEGGIPLGVFPDAEFEMGQVSLQNGDLLVLYSDGITEARKETGEEFGDARLERLVADHRSKPLGEIQLEILQSVRKWCGNEIEDDMTLVLVRATIPLKEAGHE